MIAHEPSVAVDAAEAVAEADVQAVAAVDAQVVVDAAEAVADAHLADPTVNGNALVTDASHRFRHQIQIAAE